MTPDIEESYSIVRFWEAGDWEVVSTGHTLAEAQEHCQREDTHGRDEDGRWFDGYRCDS